MSVKRSPMYSPEYNCLVSDLVEGFPPEGNEPEGAKMYVWDDITKELTYIFKKIFGSWHKY